VAARDRSPRFLSGRETSVSLSRMPRGPRSKKPLPQPPAGPPYSGAWLWNGSSWTWCSYVQLHQLVDLSMLRWQTILLLPGRAGEEPPDTVTPRGAPRAGPDAGTT